MPEKRRILRGIDIRRIVKPVAVSASIAAVAAFGTRSTPVPFSPAVESCHAITGAEVYNGGILPVGTLAGNKDFDPRRYRTELNCLNAGEPGIGNKYVPVTRIYDLFDLQLDPGIIRGRISEMVKDGILPVIRVTTYMDDKSVWQKFNPSDSYKMGRNLSQGLMTADNLPEPVTVIFGNEPNLPEEWENTPDVKEFAQSLAAFDLGMSQYSSNAKVYFPPLSWNAHFSPAEFLRLYQELGIFPGRKLGGIALTVYGKNAAQIESYAREQLQAFADAGMMDLFEKPFKFFLAETGPLNDGTGSAEFDCGGEADGFETSASRIIQDMVKRPIRLRAQIACFDNSQQIYPVIPAYDGRRPKIQR